MTQSRKGSLLEAVINVAIGAGIALVSQLIIFPSYGVNVSLSTNIKITIWFTFISVARSYLLRRAFNNWRGR
jgi:hypothetical protein